MSCLFDTAHDRAGYEMAVFSGKNLNELQDRFSELLDEFYTYESPNPDNVSHLLETLSDYLNLNLKKKKINIQE